MDEKTKDKILAILENETGIDNTSIDHNAPLGQQISFDSMQFITLVARLEHELGIIIPTTIMSATTLNDFFDRLGSLLTPKS
ncbi:MAG: acyl carrier protein [Chitinivibrionales bacterium]|nr:acyl carrier protein [Chitinivibrionales bacterium]